MSGVKGRSGRRVWSIEEKRHRVIDKAWLEVDNKLTSTDKDKISTALPIVIKDMVNKQDIDSTVRISQEEQTILDKYIHSNRLQDKLL